MAARWGGPEPVGRIQELAGGVVAFNEEANLRGAVRSLLDQRLPTGVRWGDVWVVASGCTDGTVAVAESLAGEDPRVRVVVEPDRGGKARALGAVFARARGDALVLLNSDARAEPGSVAELVSAAGGKSAPYAVMGRPVIPASTTGRWTPMLRWMWDLHHEFHLDLLADGHGSHLSDELLLVSLPTVAPPPIGVINDGSYLAVWLAQRAGGRWYAPRAQVAIQVPARLRDHLHQRRRIHVGNGQVASLLREPPSTIPEQFFRRPGATVRLLVRLLRRENGISEFARLATAEWASYALAAWDRLPPRRDHIRWQRIERPTTPTGRGGDRPPLGGTPTEERLTSLLRIAQRFDAGVDVAQLHELLPSDAPPTPAALENWIRTRPDLALVRDGRVFATTPPGRPDPGRRDLATEYRRCGDRLWSGPLRFAQSLARCAGISGSVAYGEPRRGDDLDLFVVLRSGSLWWFLARAYLNLRRARWRDPDVGAPEVCLNYVIEDRAVVAEFAGRDGLLFAREALSVDLLAGDPYYRGLLASAPWMRSELPRLYDRRTVAPGAIEPRLAPLGVRVLNALVFPVLASYLQLVGLLRNAHARRSGPSDSQFRTETGWRRVAFASARFERLRTEYGEGTAPGPAPEAGAAPSRAAAAR